MAVNWKQISDDVFVSGQLLPEDIRAAAAAGIRTIINNRPDHEERGQVENDRLAVVADECGLTFSFLPFRSGIVPEDIVRSVLTDFPEMEKPVLTFCRSGMRSELLWIRVFGELARQDDAID